MKFIDDNAELKTFCESLKGQEFITVDLEFLREKTYYAKLCLIQVACETTSAIIDPLAKNIDLAPFFEVLQDENIMKVFHSCRQDVEIIHNLTGEIPKPLFDTQIAAMVCGFGESVGYENLVKKILKKDIDKTSRLSNWSKRPLDDKQLKYALSDVTYLVEIYKKLKKDLEKNKRISWLDEEMEILTSPETYVADPMDAWQKIKHRSHNARYLTILREIAAWRERRAQRKNTIRQSIIRDECILDIAAVAPENLSELEQIRNIRKDILSGRLADEIFETVRSAKLIVPENYVEINKETQSPNFSPALHELLKMLLKIISQDEGVVAKLIATDDNLKDFASFNDENNPILKGWRKDIFGNEAIKLREGKLSITFNAEKKSIDIKEVE